MDAYECDAATKVRITDTSVKSQNSFVTVCIESTFDDIVVGSIKELTLTQSSSGLVFKAIDNSDSNSITEVSSTGTKKAAVTTRLVGAFFTDLGDVPSKIEIAGGNTHHSTLRWNDNRNNNELQQVKWYSFNIWDSAGCNGYDY